MMSPSQRFTSALSSIISSGNRKRAVLSGALFLLFVSPAASSAQVAPWWNLNTSVRPSTIPSGGEGTIVIRASNLGNAPTSGPSTLTATLPPGVSVVEKEGKPQVQFYPFSFQTALRVDLGPDGEIGSFVKYCEVAEPLITCRTEPQPPFNEGEPGEFFNLPPLNPYEFIELRVTVKDDGAAPGAEFGAEASGGGATPLARSRVLPIGPGAPAFAPEAYSLVPEAQGGAPSALAGSHPYQLTATFNLNQGAEGSEPGGKTVVKAPALARNLAFDLPPGQIGNAAALPQCGALEFAHLFEGENLCPADTAIGVASVTVYEPVNFGIVTFPVPLFNLTPAFGEPARFGFVASRSPVILDTSVRSGPGGDYGVTVSSHNTTQLISFISSTVTFWGTPGDASHDSSRGWPCLLGGYWTQQQGRHVPCEPLHQERPPAFLTLPTDCAAPFATSVEGESWPYPASPVPATFAPFGYSLTDASGNPLALSACNQVPFQPQIHSEPTSNAATSATGLNFEINVEDQGLTNSEGLAQSQLKKAVVTLPQGFTANPSVAAGLKACSEAEYESATVDIGTGCNQESKVGDVEVTSPLVQPNQVLTGGLYVAKQGENPNPTPQNPKGNLLTLYLIARNAEIGVVIKQALRVTPNPVTGQLTTEVDNVPELPFSHFHLSFRQGQRSPLVTPPTCGPYTVNAALYPWSNPGDPVERASSFQITQGPEGQPCPSGGLPPFHPGLEAGTINNRAGSFSPFYARISRKDSEQEITHFSIKLPPGVSGKLAGVAKCSDGQIAAAKAREHEGGGQEELDSPSCPAASEIGHTLVGTGVGNVLAYAPGKLYLAGPYHGAPISIAAITAAKVGPFDLGTVVVREALKVNSETAEVFVDATGSDPIPHIVDGIPTHLRDIRIYVDRPEFVLNPTGCEKTSTAATVLGSGLDFVSEADDNPVTVSSPFQAADCAALGFKPKLTLALKGGTKRSQVPALKATLTARKGDANIARSEVILPHSEFLEQNHLGSTCTRVQYNAGAGHGAGCPANSLIGRARAVTPILSEPLEGNVYLRSNGSERKLPDMVAALNGQEINIDLVGFIDSVREKNGHGETVSRIRNRFQAVPDAPVEKFTLELFGGKRGLLVNSTNLCKGKHNAKVAFTGHNGRLEEFKAPLQTSCKKAKKKRKKR
jgi:hypothetical protein